MRLLGNENCKLLVLLFPILRTFCKMLNFSGILDVSYNKRLYTDNCLFS